MRYRKILWDFDGTLAYTSRDVWHSLEYAADQCGGRLPQDFLSNDSNLALPMQKIFKRVYPAPEAGEYERFEELVRVHYRTLSEYKDTCFYPGIHKLLLKLKAEGVSHDIITMKPKEALERLLKKKGWTELFDGLSSPDSFPGEERTKREMIAHVIQKTGLKKSQYVYIGDTWSDVAAANENGIDCIGVVYGDGDTDKLLACHPKYCIQDASEIENIIKEGA